ncbi:hypothetical protein BD769DRAFT_1428771 [Suillus cothurnatus]|nr:hypothetical protein BD769DRAFT_1428771 [Suillus cothurnatus]
MTNDIQHVIAGRLMRISSQCAIVLAVIATLTSSISAVPAEADGEKCPVFCHKYSQCTTCLALQSYLLCFVSRVSPFTSLQYGSWH